MLHNLCTFSGWEQSKVSQDPPVLNQYIHAGLLHVEFKCIMSCTLKHSLSPVGELHHKVKDSQHHEEMKEWVTVCHSILFVIHMSHPEATFIIILRRFFLFLFLLIWNTIAAQDWANRGILCIQLHKNCHKTYLCKHFHAQVVTAGSRMKQCQEQSTHADHTVVCTVSNLIFIFLASSQFAELTSARQTETTCMYDSDYNVHCM